MSKQLDDSLIWETIFGQVISKANNYIVADSGGMKHIIKNEQIRQYESSFSKQCKIYRDKYINGKFRLFIDVFASSERGEFNKQVQI